MPLLKQYYTDCPTCKLSLRLSDINLYMWGKARAYTSIITNQNLTSEYISFDLGDCVYVQYVHGYFLNKICT